MPAIAAVSAAVPTMLSLQRLPVMSLPTGITISASVAAATVAAVTSFPDIAAAIVAISAAAVALVAVTITAVTFAALAASHVSSNFWGVHKHDDGTHVDGSVGMGVWGQ